MSKLFLFESIYKECSTFDPSLPPIFDDYNEQPSSNIKRVFPQIPTNQILECTTRNKCDFVQHLLRGLAGVFLSDLPLDLRPWHQIWCINDLIGSAPLSIKAIYGCNPQDNDLVEYSDFNVKYFWYAQSFVFDPGGRSSRIGTILF